MSKCGNKEENVYEYSTCCFTIKLIKIKKIVYFVISVPAK